jgi:ferritin-like metal-binding protein YciE
MAAGTGKPNNLSHKESCMKFFSANLQDLRELYINSLEKALDMEQQITKTLPTMIDKASDPQLKQGLQTHLQETEGHVSRVQSILQQCTGDASTETCKVMAALATEGSDMIKDAGDPSVCDAAIIAACQEVEHHEMAVYGTLRTWANILGETAQAQELEQILNQEKHADEVLTSVSNRVNMDAQSGSSSRAA